MPRGICRARSASAPDLYTLLVPSLRVNTDTEIGSFRIRFAPPKEPSVGFLPWIALAFALTVAASGGGAFAGFGVPVAGGGGGGASFGLPVVGGGGGLAGFGLPVAGGGG